MFLLLLLMNFVDIMQLVFILPFFAHQNCRKNVLGYFNFLWNVFFRILIEELMETVAPVTEEEMKIYEVRHLKLFLDIRSKVLNYFFIVDLFSVN